MERLSARAKAYIRSHIRLAWRYYSAYRQKIKLTKRCAICDKVLTPRNLRVDHIKPVGKFVAEDQPYIVKMFTDLDNLQGLCHPCNAKKRDK